MKRAAIYMRVSSDKQAQEGDSLAAQRAALMRLKTVKYYHCVNTLLGVYYNHNARQK